MNSIKERQPFLVEFGKRLERSKYPYDEDGRLSILILNYQHGKTFSYSVFLFLG